MEKVRKQFEDQNQTIMVNIAFFLLQKIGHYPFDLFKINFNNILPKILMESPDAFCELVEARSKTPPFIKGITTGNIQTHKSVIFSETNLWQSDKELMENKASENGDFSNYLGYQTQGKILLRIIDIPNIHNQVFKN